MATLRLMKGRNTWHANFRNAAGKQTTVNLHVPIKGKAHPSGSVREKGTPAFERSRAKAEQALSSLVNDLADDRAAIRAQENVARLKTGKRHKVPRLSEVEALAAKLCKGGEVQKQTVTARARQFVEAMRKRKDGDVQLSHITGGDVQAFFDGLQDSASVFKRRKGELRRLFSKALPPGTPNPVDHDDLTTPEHIEADEHQPRKPFTPEQITRIYEEAEGTSLYGPIVAAVATGMRKGDVCTLEWKSVFLKRGMIRVQHTRKTKKEIMIPIPVRLGDVLKNRFPTGYVFPEVAELYLSGKSGQRELRKSLKEILARALAPEDEAKAPELRQEPPAVAYVACSSYVDTLTTTERRKARFRDVARLYLLDGLSYNQIQAQHGIAKAQSSEALKEMESATSIQLIRNPQNGGIAKARDLTTTALHGRRARQSVYDWHSFRTTFVTEALKAGWSVPDVQSVTGHATVDVVLKHYYDPGEEHLKSLQTPATAAI